MPAVFARFSLLACLLVLLAGGADWPKWTPRCRSGIAPNHRATALIDPATWREEPKTPKAIRPKQFARALSALCAGLPRAQAERYAGWVLASAKRHRQDPFLLGALMHRMSRCSETAKSPEGYGLTSIQPTMYRENVDGRVLSYLVPDGSTWAERRKVLPVPLTARSLRKAEPHIEWTAALLAMWEEQHRAADKKFEQIPHRHFVSHFVWGDQVRSDRAEDRIFTDRRRLLLYYGEIMPEPTRTFRRRLWGLRRSADFAYRGLNEAALRQARA